MPSFVPVLDAQPCLFCIQNDTLNLDQPYYEGEDSLYANDLLLPEIPDEFWRTLEEDCEEPTSEEAVSDDQGLFSPNDFTPCFLKKRPWTYEEDKKLMGLLEEYDGSNQW